MVSKSEKSAKINSYIYYITALIIILIIVILYFTFFRLDVKIKSDKILRCSDGTVYNSCSIDKPFYCSNGNLVSIPAQCGCSDGLVLADNLCKNASDLLPDSNFSCQELVPKDLSVRFGDTGYPSELIDISNSLINDIPLKNIPGKYCLNHLPAKAGENINVINLFYCYGYSNAGGGVDSSGIVQRAYKISYQLEMDKSKCTNLSTSASGSFKKCTVNSINCSWSFTN